jgi:hypothetical protein
MSVDLVFTTLKNNVGVLLIVVDGRVASRFQSCSNEVVDDTYP